MLARRPCLVIVVCCMISWCMRTEFNAIKTRQTICTPYAPNATRIIAHKNDLTNIQSNYTTTSLAVTTAQLICIICSLIDDDACERSSFLFRPAGVLCERRVHKLAGPGKPNNFPALRAADLPATFVGRIQHLLILRCITLYTIFKRTRPPSSSKCDTYAQYRCACGAQHDGVHKMRKCE